MTAEAAPAVRVPSLSIDVHEHAGTAVVRVVGELDTAAAACLRGVLADVLGRPDVTRCVVDLAEVTFLDCAGLQPVVEAHRSAPRTGRSLVLRSAPAVDRLLHLTGLEDLLPRVPG